MYYYIVLYYIFYYYIVLLYIYIDFSSVLIKKKLMQKMRPRSPIPHLHLSIPANTLTHAITSNATNMPTATRDSASAKTDTREMGTYATNTIPQNLPINQPTRLRNLTSLPIPPRNPITQPKNHITRRSQNIQPSQYIPLSQNIQLSLHIPQSHTNPTILTRNGLKFLKIYHDQIWIFPKIFH